MATMGIGAEASLQVMPILGATELASRLAASYVGNYVKGYMLIIYAVCCVFLAVINLLALMATTYIHMMFYGVGKRREIPYLLCFYPWKIYPYTHTSPCGNWCFLIPKIHHSQLWFVRVFRFLCLYEKICVYLNKPAINSTINTFNTTGLGLFFGPIVASMYSSGNEVLYGEDVQMLYCIFRTGSGIACLMGPLIAGKYDCGSGCVDQ